MKILYTIILLFIFLINPLFGDVIILPYKVKNPSKKISSDYGIEYSKLLITASLLKKNIEIVTFNEGYQELKNMGLSHGEKITADDLNTIGKRHNSDHILLGSISKSKGKYLSKSILYSSKQKRIIRRISVKAKNIFKLAEKEINRAFANYSDKIKTDHKSKRDIAFLIDLSYNINHQWQSIQDGIISASSTLIDKQQINTRIYIIPFSSKVNFSKNSISNNSIIAIKKSFRNLHPSGKSTSKNFEKALNYSVKNIIWRRDSLKEIIIITNSEIKKNRFFAKYAYYAKRKGIIINSFLLDNLTSKKANIFIKLATGANGKSKKVSYYQKVFNAKAKGLNLFFENGRLFYADYFDPNWKNGLISYNRYQASYGKPKDFINEIFLSGDKNINSRTMSLQYSKEKDVVLIKKYNIKNNFSSLLNNHFITNNNSGNSQKNLLGKALLSDGTVSIWINIYQKNYIDILNRYNSSKHYFSIALKLKKDPSTVYGIKFTPVDINITSDNIPDLIYGDLSKIIKNRTDYTRIGLFYPPVWFIKVKISKLNIYNQTKDIRDM